MTSIINRRYSDYKKQKDNYSELLLTPGNLLIVSRYINRNLFETKMHLVKNMQKYPYNI